MPPVRASYVKTLLSCIVVVVVTLPLIFVSLAWLATPFAAVAAAVAALVTIAAALLTLAATVVLIRDRRARRGDPDLFMRLNRSRDEAAIVAAGTRRRSGLLRWLAKQLLGHDLLVGDWVEVRSRAEIDATLDDQSCFEQLPFMPEMRQYCGQRAYVLRCAHRVFDYRKSRRMRHLDGAVLLTSLQCDGAHHGGCEASCYMIWKSAWLRRVDANAASVGSAAGARVAVGNVADVPNRRYRCQLTQLHDATRPIGDWSAGNFVRPLVSGNVAPLAFCVGWLTHLFNQLQYRRGGVDVPAFDDDEPQRPDTAHGGDVLLRRDEPVRVRSAGEIRITLNDRSLNRGLYFEPDMLKHCGRRYRVQCVISKLVDVVSGELITMKTPAYVLRDVRFSGERQLFNAQQEALFWRSRWLRRDVD